MNKFVTVHGVTVRGLSVDQVMQYAGVDYLINGIRVTVVRMTATKKYWVIANNENYDDRFTDIGPFDTPEEALLVLKLHS